MEKLNKRLMSLILSAAITTSVAPTVANAMGNEQAETESTSIEAVDSVVRNMDGLYTSVVDGVPVYAYLGNDKRNEYLLRDEAYNLAGELYGVYYVFAKKVDNPNYVQGVSPEDTKTITVFAISTQDNVEGWTRVPRDYVNASQSVATSIELGEFMLKGVDLSSYTTNMLGFGYIDVNKDGFGDIVYIGNNKANYMLTKEDAILFANKNYEKYYFQVKSVPNPDYVEGINSKDVSVYAISDAEVVDGYTKVSASEVPDYVNVASNTEYMDANVYIDAKAKEASKTEDKTDTNVNGNTNPNTNNNVAGISVNPITMKKDKALEYAYSHYPEFCIMTKVINNPAKEDGIEVLYAFSFVVRVDGWSIIGNDFIPSNASIFLTLEDAYAHIYDVENNYGKTLK